VTTATDTGAVVIGRNEGERLRRCLTSLRGSVDRLVYVDSGSTDGSVSLAEGLGAKVVELDTEIPFTMARARNVGFRCIRDSFPDVTRVQFVDGDCEVAATWLPAARRFMDEHPEAAIVCGRRRERAPDESPYNRIVDVEWDGPVGRVSACGGDALVRTAAFEQVDGFNPSMIAGEEGEMCCRLRLAGWEIWRLDEPMTLHDAAIHRFGQWWKRSTRCGHAYAEGYTLHGRSSLRHNARQIRSTVAWGIVAPVLAVCALLGGLLSGRMELLLVPALVAVGYALLGSKVFVGRRRRGDGVSDSARYAAACVVGKLAEAQGALQYVLGRESRLIEYK